MGNQNSQLGQMHHFQSDQIISKSKNNQKQVQNNTIQNNKNFNVKTQVKQHKNKFLNCFINQEIQYQVKLIQFLLNFLTIKEALQFRLINKEMKFIVEMSSNIYANYLSQLFIRQIHLSNFVEYGADKRFKTTINEQILKVELSQDECWPRIYKSYLSCIQKLQQVSLNLPINLKEIITESIIDPLLPIAILTDDVLKQSTSSWFQLYMAQNHDEVNSNIEADQQLNEAIEKLYQNCLYQFSPQNMEQAQILQEIRWVIIDNFIKDPNTMSDSIPDLLKLGSYIMHLIYLRCLFAKKVLQIIQSTNVFSSLLNFYVILWRAFMGFIWRLNIYFEDLFKYINQIYLKNYQTQIPSYNLATISGRIWTQVVLMDEVDLEDESLEQNLLLSFRTLLNTKRDQLLEFFVKERPQKVNSIQNNKKLHDSYFRYMPNAINCLLGHFSSSFVDISMEEQSIHWIGHTNSQIGEPFSKLQKQLISDTNMHYQNAALFLGTNYQSFLDYIQADSRFLQEIINRWTVQIKIVPIGIQYLYNNLEMEVQKYNNTPIKLTRTKSCQDQQIQTPNQQFLESKQLTQQQMELFKNFLDDNLQNILERQKINIDTPQINENQQSQNIQQKTQSRYSDLAKYSQSNYKCQTNLKSSTPLFNQVSNNDDNNKKFFLAQNLKKIQDLESENQSFINIRDNKINQRNNLKKIILKNDQELHTILSFKTTAQIEKLMSYYELNIKGDSSFLQTLNPSNQFIELSSDGQNIMQQLQWQEIQMQ